MERGIDGENGVLLSGGAAGDFSTMTFEERLRVAEAIVEEAGGRVPVAMGAQTTSTRELVALARAAERLGCDFIQVSCPFYFTHTEGDFYDYVVAAAEAAAVGIIVYNTFWTSSGVSLDLVDRLCAIPYVVGLKWATPRSDAMEFEDVVSHFAGRLTIIDNNLLFAMSHMLGARAFEVHLCNYWPEWGIRLLERLGARDYAEVQRMMVEEAMPFYKLWVEIERDYTSATCGTFTATGPGRCSSILGCPTSSASRGNAPSAQE
jgi:dihydrodipicolinate synthase/N-acetylneuraminate lyase